MANSAKHRALPMPRTWRRRVVGMGVAGAACIATVGVTAPAAHAWGVWDRVAACESGGNWTINTGNGYYGGLQFAQSTWVGFGGQQYASYAHQASKSQQIAVAQKVLAGQGPGAWPVCSVRAGLTRENGGGGGSAPPVTPPPPPVSSPPVNDPPVSNPPANNPPSGWVGTPVTRYVTADQAANVRSGPGNGYRVVASLSRGTEVNGTQSGGWVKIGDGRYIGTSVLSSSPADGRGQTPPSRGVGRALVVDGINGPLTTTAIQAWVGTERDGVLGPITTKALQTKVGTVPDGVWGPQSQAALQDYLGIERDGSTSMNSRTVQALQRFLNSNVIG